VLFRVNRIPKCYFSWIRFCHPHNSSLCLGYLTQLRVFFIQRALLHNKETMSVWVFRLQKQWTVLISTTFIKINCTVKWLTELHLKLGQRWTCRWWLLGCGAVWSCKWVIGVRFLAETGTPSLSPRPGWVLGPTSLCNGHSDFPHVKSSRRLNVTTHSHVEAKLRIRTPTTAYDFIKRCLRTGTNLCYILNCIRGDNKLWIIRDKGPCYLLGAPQSSYWETDSRYLVKIIPRRLRNQKVLYDAHRCP
jgi:hypothetical protein